MAHWEERGRWNGLRGGAGLSPGEGLLGADVLCTRASHLSDAILTVESRDLSRLIAGTKFVNLLSVSSDGFQ